ncbi:MAG: Peptidoglycan glycosyltransferase [Microgenomates group bacterium GW2011_GWC1_43_11]|uniref:Peptidoglycan glycosyltransferase n=2 Tax=Candidatus Gottesmaniibacteriota TaxID=1752720 RepID=A0A0G1IQB1_9BACT|nr:MAG: Peptidoglycan glycosyltransferase [Microgenomates group bacterium GW2011_GWC1_43_11]KKT38751.1 MAG: Peptidoglycan glycosyltransferase [Candidatus Gottesmanbacteria bacterium GW2011_GWB1_44_11c]KKT61335.1 MAG: Peptidoglycan glycosyltransferase [Candidatus Gottesmanbacteria bacterium GW2011_GWA1_44_24b]
MIRIWTVFGCFILLYIAIVTRLFYWQVWVSGKLKNQAISQHFFRFSLPPKRGTIYSSDGYPFIMNQQAYLVYGEPKEIKDIDGFAKRVADIVAVDYSSISSQLKEPGRVWVPILHKAVKDTVDRLKALNEKGLGFEPEPKRYYPEASMAAHFLGFVGLDQNGMDRGYFGLEGFYDRELKGKEGSLQIEKDVQGNPILIGQTYRVDPQDGRNLIVWVDRSVQAIVEKRLKDGMEKYGAKEGSVVVMDPKTGGIVAMASLPSYDPRTYFTSEKGQYINPVVGSTYEPGSTFKVLIMAAGINEKVITPTTTMEETGPVEVSGYTIRTWNNKYNGTVAMTDVLVHSSNVGMVYVSQKLGKEKLLSSLKNFGLGKPTNVDLEDESAPQLREDKEWRDIDVATASFGQGIAVTPLQMIRAVSAIANGGSLMEPHVVKAMVDTNGKTTQVPPKKIRQVITRKTAEEVTEMMVASVEQGEAKFAKPAGYRIAGKTGTAQIPVEGHYDETKTIASFVGFAPADNPKFVMLVTLREPSSSQWGSETAAPLFFNIAKDLFLYYGIAPK